MSGGDATVAAGSNVIALGLTVAALWGASDFLGGLAARKAPALLVVALAHGISMAALVSLAAVAHAVHPSERTAVWGLVAGISGGLALIVFYRALAGREMGMPAALAGLLTALVPVVFSWIAEGRPKAGQISGFVIASVAIYLFAHEPHGRPHPRALGLSAIAGLGFGVFLIASKFASQGALLWPLAISRVTSASLAAAILFAVHAGRRRSPALDGTGNHWLLESVRPILWLAGSAGILEAAGNLLYMRATLAGRLDVAAVLSSFYPAGTILLAVWLLKERTTLSKTLGMILALIAIVMISL
jgi:drug/metabolite transporter (DMT)-like permease